MIEVEMINTKQDSLKSVRNGVRRAVKDMEQRTRLFAYLLPLTAFLFLCFTHLYSAPAIETPSVTEPAVTPVVSSQDSGIQMLLSQNIEERIKESVSSILVNERFSVSVKVFTKKEQERKEIVKSAEERAVIEEEDEILPGIPKLKTPTSDKKQQLDQSVIKLISKITIQKVSVKIFVDSGLSDSLIESVKKVASSAAGLDFGRGDDIAVEKILYPKPELVKKMWVSDFLLNPRYLWIAVGAMLGLLFLIFLFGPARTLAKSYIQAMQFAAMARSESKELSASAAEGKEQSKTDGMDDTALKTAELEMEEALAAASAEISQSLSAPSAPSKGIGGRDGNGHRPFSFVNEKSLPNFLHLIQREPLPAVAVAVHYLDPSIGAQVLSALPMDKRAQVIQILSKVQEQEPDDVHSLEAKVQERLHFVVGGEDKLRDLISFADPEIQMTLLAAVRSVDPMLSEKVERTMVSIESLAGVEPAVLQAVIRHMGLRNFCPLMLSLTEPLREKIVAKLPGGQLQKVKEEIELSKPLPPMRYKEERNKLITTLRKLQQEGVLTV